MPDITLPKLDLHTHILPPPEKWPVLRDKYGYGGWVQLKQTKPCCASMMIDDRHFRDVNQNCWDPHTRITECDSAYVAIQTLSTVPVMFSYWARAKDAHDLARWLNDHIADVCSEFPKRFRGLGTIPMQDADLAIAELERCRKELKLPGVQIGSNVNGLNLDHPSLFPIFEAAQRLDACIFVHPWEMLGRDRMQKYWTPWLVGMPAETALAITSMICGGVFERLPRLRVCFAHGGGSFPFTIGRIEHGFLARPDLCACDNGVNPREYLGRFWVDSLVHDADALRLLIKVIGERKVAMGSDYPFPLGEQVPGALIESMADVSIDMKKRLLAVNAMEFLGLVAGS